MPKIVADKTEWIKLGFELFAQQGTAGIIVDKMANKLKCNRSSFYWHFSSKEEFINQLIDYWIENHTEQIIEATRKKCSAHKKFRDLVVQSFKKDLFLDFIFFLKRYALKRKDIAETIDKVDKQRIDFVVTLLQEIGHTKAEASVKASIFYKYLIGYHEMIRYKNQSENFVDEVYEELKQFIIL